MKTHQNIKDKAALVLFKGSKVCYFVLVVPVQKLLLLQKPKNRCSQATFPKAVSCYNVSRWRDYSSGRNRWVVCFFALNKHKKTSFPRWSYQYCHWNILVTKLFLIAFFSVSNAFFPNSHNLPMNRSGIQQLRDIWPLRNF